MPRKMPTDLPADHLALARQGRCLISRLDGVTRELEAGVTCAESGTVTTISGNLGPSHSPVQE